MNTSPPISPYLALGFGLLAVSTASLFIRYAQADGAPSLVIAAYRLSLATLVLLPLTLARHRAELLRLTRREWGLALISGAFLGLHFATWISSLAYTSVANSVVFVSTAPLFVAVIAALFLKERLTRAVLLGMGVALAGSLLVGVSDACRPDTGCPTVSDFLRGEGFLGDLLALAGAAAVAVYLIIGRRVRGGMPLLVYILLTYGTAALTLLVGAVASGAMFANFSPRAFLWIGLLALIPQLIGHSTYNWALRYLPATFVSVTVLGEPIGSIALAFAFLGETPTPLKLLGGALILSGIVIASMRARES